MGVIAATTMVMTMTPAVAAGSFTWDATIKTGIKSRTWTTKNKGDITITANFPCWKNDATYKIVLIREKFGSDERYTSVTYSCGSTQQYTWENKPADEYHFNLTKASDGKKVSGSGKVFYN